VSGIHERIGVHSIMHPEVLAIVERRRAILTA
jgi:hypothetical protein